MTTIATLESTLVEVEPGAETVCRLEIRNTASIVEAYDIQVLGEAAEWTVAEPAAVSVYPGTEEHVSIRFRPPRSAKPLAGDVRYGVLITPTERPGDQVVPEGVVRVLPFPDTAAEIVPRTSRARLWARHEVAVDNRGNRPVEVAFTGGDPDGRLTVAAKPDTVVVAPGEAVFTKVTVRNRRLLWRGQPATRPFQVLVVPDDAPPLQLDAATVQAPVVPRGATRVLAALLILLLLGAGLWYTVLKPAVKSAAKEAVAQPIASLQANQSKLDGQINGPGGVAQGGGAKTPPPAPAGSAAPAPQPAPAGGVPAGATSFNQTARNFTNGGANSSVPYTAPSGRTLVLTDFYLQNPQGDSGKLELVVDGTSFFTWSLANFRDLDYHAVSPIELPAGKTVTVRLTCVTPGPTLAGFGSPQCRVWALLSGYQKATPTPTPAA
jgi:hypothetical protein